MVLSDAPDVDAVLSRFFGRDVELAHAAQNGYTIDQYHPDEENYDPEGHRDEVVEARLGAAFFNERGLPSAVPEGSFFDLFPLSVLTTSSLDQLGELEPQSRFDARRFRMNVIVETPAPGFVENEWLGRTLAIGDDVRIGVALPDPRCVMSSLAQEDLPKDSRILKALASTTGSTSRVRSTPAPASTPSQERPARSAGTTASAWSEIAELDRLRRPAPRGRQYWCHRLLARGGWEDLPNGLWGALTRFASGMRDSTVESARAP